MTLSPNVRHKVRTLLGRLVPEFSRIAQARSCTLEVISPGDDRDVPFILFRNAQGRIALEVLPAVPNWRSWTVNSYAADMNDAAEAVGERIGSVRDEDDGMFSQVDVKKQR